jgi:hypothetical protein
VLISRLKNTVGWFAVREKYCFEWKNKLKTDYKPDKQDLCICINTCPNVHARFNELAASCMHALALRAVFAVCVCACSCTHPVPYPALFICYKAIPESRPMLDGYLRPRMKVVWIFSYRIRDRIHLEGFRSVHIRVWIFNIWYCIRIRILKSHMYDVDI